MGARLHRPTSSQQSTYHVITIGLIRAPSADELTTERWNSTYHVIRPSLLVSPFSREVCERARLIHTRGVV